MPGWDFGDDPHGLCDGAHGFGGSHVVVVLDGHDQVVVVGGNVQEEGVVEDGNGGNDGLN